MQVWHTANLKRKHSPLQQRVFYQYAQQHSKYIWISASPFKFFEARYLKEHFFLWLYSPILGLGHLHKTFHFTSVTRSTRVSRTPWTGDQLIARLLHVCPGWLWWWRSWWNERFWQGKLKYSEKTCPDATLFTTNPTCQTRVAAVGSQRLTVSAMAQLKRTYRRMTPGPIVSKFSVHTHT
jgi:hypothetical protein